MPNELRIALELGPKGKRVVAFAPDWPGFERGDKTEEAVVSRLDAYRPRYAKVAKLAGLEREFVATGDGHVVERYEGTGSTDFWGISFAFSSTDQQEMASDELDRELNLLQACWKYFDEVRSRVSAEMKRGPRGGGRDRNTIVRHVLLTEQEFGEKLGGPRRKGEVVTDPEGLETFRKFYCDSIRTFHSEGKRARTWPLRYLVRHSAYHVMDHAWEMEDKDLSEG